MVKDAYLLKGFALAHEALILGNLGLVLAMAPFRHMVTPGGFTMSVAMTNCGLGWVTDRKGYRYTDNDPVTNQPWPVIPDSFKELASAAATEAGFMNFEPDACLINRYNIGARMSLHQDKNEQDFSRPIVSVSLGLPAIFQFGGLERTDKTIKIPLRHGDMVVWGGEARLRYHGVLPLKTNYHPAFGNCRINLTFRKAG
ncbi:MAG: DNA oxidative demethylase AlkB [Methylotenera sp.]|nr:DNA oxidative demethylase AlkB [Methylotenera sp.]